MPRLTKSGVVSEVIELRKRIHSLCEMNYVQICEQYVSHYPVNLHLVADGVLSYSEMLQSLLMSATYHLTNVLGIE